MGNVINIIEVLGQLVAFMAGTHLIVKFVPIKWLAYVDNNLMPLLGALIAFFGPLQGLASAPSPSPIVPMGFFGDLGGHLGIAGKALLATGVPIIGHMVHETILRAVYKKVGLKKYVIPGVNDNA